MAGHIVPRTQDGALLLLYFEQDCPQSTLTGLMPGKPYRAVWFNPRTGGWLDDQAMILTSQPDQRLLLPPFPGGQTRSQVDWALKLTCVDDS